MLTSEDVFLRTHHQHSGEKGTSDKHVGSIDKDVLHIFLSMVGSGGGGSREYEIFRDRGRGQIQDSWLTFADAAESTACVLLFLFNVRHTSKIIS